MIRFRQIQSSKINKMCWILKRIDRNSIISLTTCIAVEQHSGHVELLYTASLYSINQYYDYYIIFRSLKLFVFFVKSNMHIILLCIHIEVTIE